MWFKSSLACGHGRGRTLADYQRGILRCAGTLPVGKAMEQLMDAREPLTLVVGKDDDTIGLVTLEDLIEALLGMEITDEADAVEQLRPAIAHARRRRTDALKRRRESKLPRPD